ncbi:MAG: DUF1801 domain-containing protein [Demequina sp.]
MGTNATPPIDEPVKRFLDAVEPASRRAEGFRLLEVMAEVTGEPATMWGRSIVGFGTVHYAYASGREGDTMRVGFSPRRPRLSLYGLKDHPDSAAILDRLGPHTAGAGCVYLTRLDAIDEGALRELVALAAGDEGDEA